MNKNTKETETKKTVKQRQTSPVRRKTATNPILGKTAATPAAEINMSAAMEQEANNIVARINNFNEKNQNRLYGGFMTDPRFQKIIHTWIIWI